MRLPLVVATSMLVLVALAAAGCGLMRQIGFAPNEVDPGAMAEAAPVPDEPSHVVVQHVLIAFEGASVPGVTRTKDEAKRLAQRVLAEARRGCSFDDLVRDYSDDRAKGGRYAIANWGVPSAFEETDRRTLVHGFTALAFSLAVGQVGLVEYDASASPFGWHVMKRLE